MVADPREHARPGRCKDSKNVPEGRAGAPAPTPGHVAQPALRRPLGTVPPGLQEPSQAQPQASRCHSPWSPFPLALVQEGGGEAWGRTTGAKALFCFTAEMTLAGENEKMPCALLQFEGRVTEEAAMVGLDGTTATKQTRSGRAAPCGQHDTESSRAARDSGATAQACHVSGVAPLWTTGKRLCRTRFQLGGPVSFRFGWGFQCDRVGPG